MKPVSSGPEIDVFSLLPRKMVLHEYSPKDRGTVSKAVHVRSRKSRIMKSIYICLALWQEAPYFGRLNKINANNNILGSQRDIQP
jgi:hypothetical protein